MAVRPVGQRMGGFARSGQIVGKQVAVDSTNCYEAQLPAELGSVVAARRLVDSAVASWGIADDVAEAAALAVSEFVTNAVLHAGTVVSVRVRRLGDGVRLEVEDGSPEPLVLSPDPPEDFLATPAMTGSGPGPGRRDR